MQLKAIARKLDRAAVIYRDEGMAAVASRLLQRCRRFAGGDDQSHADWLARKLVDDAKFDRAHGTQTGGIQELFELQIVGESARYGNSHIASGADEFTNMMTELDIEYSTFTFVDLGSGKGRALMLAAAFPFRRIIGIEFAVEFHEAAKANFVPFATMHSAMPEVEFICGDAAAYEFPHEPLIVYLFNPFGPAVIRRVAERALTSWRNAKRPIHVLYMNPLHVSEFIAAGWQLCNDGRSYAHLVPRTG